MSGTTNVPRDFDRLLDAWLDEGPNLYADRVVGSALAQVESVKQAQPLWPPRWMRREPSAVPRAFALVLAVTVLLVAAIGVGIVGGFIRLNPQPQPGPTTDQDVRLPQELVFDADGFSVVIPNGWQQVSTTDDGVWRFEGGDPPGQLTVSFGDSIIASGVVAICHLGSCEQEEIESQVPYDETRSLGQLQVVINVRLDPELNTQPGLADATLGGLAAEQQAEVAGGRRHLYVYAIHESRPIVLYWSVPEASFTETELLALVDGFTFIDPPPASSPIPGIDEEYVEITDAAGGYRMLVPYAWEESGAQEPEGTASVRSFGSAVDYGHAALTITVGELDGSIWLCGAGGCDLHVVNTLAELEEAIVSEPTDLPGVQVIHVDTTLGGEPARIERLDTGGFIWGPPAFYNIYTFHDGRPVVIQLDNWTLTNELLGVGARNMILRSFTFLD
jgi:hypothetical protein